MKKCSSRNQTNELKEGLSVSTYLIHLNVNDSFKLIHVYCFQFKFVDQNQTQVRCKTTDSIYSNRIQVISFDYLSVQSLALQ